MSLEIFPVPAGIEWMHLLGSSPLEIIATVCAVVGVVLIARQNILGWPIGLVWSVISSWLAFSRWHLVSDGILYLSGIPIQIYCWRVWLRHGNTPASVPFSPTWMPRRRQALVAIAAALSILLWGLGIAALAGRIPWIPQPDLLWRDSTTTVLNYYAQFLQARKRMENWIGWVIVNLLGIHIYWVKDAPIYAFQYGCFLLLGLYGWRQWHKHRALPPSGSP